MTRTNRTETSRRLTGRRLTAVCAGITAAAIAIPAVAFELANPSPTPVDRVAFVARNDNPFDALALGPVAGALGGIVVITDSAGLSQDAADGLTAFDPDRVFVAGGEVALSPQVETDLEALGDWDVDRVAGENRNETARLLGEILDTLGVGRPVLTGATVEGNAFVTGEIAGGLEPHTTFTGGGSGDHNGTKLTPAVANTVEIDVPADGHVMLHGLVQVHNTYASDMRYLVAMGASAGSVVDIPSGGYAMVPTQGVREVTEGTSDVTLTIMALLGPAATPIPFEWAGASIEALYLPPSHVTIQE